MKCIQNGLFPFTPSKTSFETFPKYLWGSSIWFTYNFDSRQKNNKKQLIAAYNFVSPQFLERLFLRIDKNECQIWTQRPPLCVIWHQARPIWLKLKSDGSWGLFTWRLNRIRGCKQFEASCIYFSEVSLLLRFQLVERPMSNQSRALSHNALARCSRW